MNIGIVGLGLVGASYAKAFQRDGRFTVFGTDIVEKNIDNAIWMGEIKAPLTEDNLPDCNLVIVALYPQDTIAYIRANAARFNRNAIVIDCCGIKESVCEAIAPIALEHGFTFIGTDPFAGKTGSGYDASTPTLFDNQTVILTPDETVPSNKLENLRMLLCAAGFTNVMTMTPQKHDETIALTSQLTHIISSALVRSPKAESGDIFFSGSFKDLIKRSKMNEQMWSEVFIGNKKYLVDEIDTFIKNLREFKGMIETGSSVDLRRTIREGSGRRHEIVQNNIVTVSASHSYDVIVERGILKHMGDYVKSVSGASTVVLVVGDIVGPLYADTVTRSIEEKGIRVLTYVLPHGEQAKCESQLFDLLEFMGDNDVTRSDLMIALGGGVTGDLTGCAASLFMRGMNYIQVPTTLLAAVDSSVGGKTAIDLKAGKNMAGAFKQPRLVICDTETLNTLPPEEFAAGMGEVIKYGVLCDPELFAFLETNDIREKIEEIIIRCITIKRNVVMADEFDTGARATLNLGHTLAHTIEKCSNFTVKHGHAVAIGLVAVAKCAWIAGLAEENCAPRIAALCEKSGLPTTTDIPLTDLVSEITRDKKRSGSSITLVIPRRIGECSLMKMDLAKAEEFYLHTND